jgi:hypothetical protein
MVTMTCMDENGRLYQHEIPDQGAGPEPEPKRPVYVVGLDLGQQVDYSALCILEVHDRHTTTSRHLVRHLQRWPLRTPYPTIVADVARMVGRAPIGKTDYLVVDATGVGPPVVDLLKAADLPVTLVPITITGGSQVVRDGKSYHTPKRDLVSTVTVLLQGSRLRIAPELPEAPILTDELQNFQTKITSSANETFGAWREGTHDDLVLSVAMAAWYAENARGLPAYVL